MVAVIYAELQLIDLAFCHNEVGFSTTPLVPRKRLIGLPARMVCDDRGVLRIFAVFSENRMEM